MPEIMQKVEDGASMADLEKTFRQFRRRTDALRNTYVELRDEAERMNEELRDANERLETKVHELEQVNSFQNSILASLPVGVTVTDLQGVIQRFNPAAEEIWNVAAADAIGQPVDDVMGRDAAAVQDVLAGEVQGQAVKIEREESEQVLSTTVNLVKNSRGNAIGAIQLDRDVSQVHRLKNQLTHSESLADLGRSAAGMAHEVRKPLNGIKGFASLLQRVTEGESADKYSSRIMEAAGRLDSMLENLLDFARPGDLDQRPVDLRLLGQRVAEFVDVEDVDDTPEVDISVDVGDRARFASGDPRKLEQVLLNLVKNGVEAIESAGEVNITADRLQHNGEEIVEIGVHDTGEGIPVDKQEEIMEPFTTNKDGGTGLGLAMVQKILRLHGTKMNIDSEPGQGTTMKFYLSATEKGDKNDQ